MRNTLLALLALTTSAVAQPVSLFDGKTLDGWDFDPKIWRVEDGMITGGSTSEKITENHFICTKKSFQNFELTLKIKVSGDPKTGMLNSGIQIRSLRVPGGAHMSGYQVDCGAGWFGKIYDEFRRNKVIAEPLDAAALEKAVDVKVWNEYRIRAEGPRIQTWINGVRCIDYTERDPNIALDGLLGPQVHSGGVCLVQVKDVTLEELPPTPDAPTWEKLGGVEAARKLVAPPSKPGKKAIDGKPKGNDGAASQNIPGTKRDISYNNVESTALTAQEQLRKFHVADGYEIELVVQESEGLGKFVSVYFDQRGRMWTQTALEYPVDGNENPAAAEAVYAAKGKDKVLVFPREALNATLPAGGLTDPTVFADGLAIPTGILPWGNGDTCYIQHGHDLKLFKDTNGDGQADTFDIVLTGFGVQDSHLFPHQFTRAPGGWIWMAQGLFNNSQVHKPGSKDIVEWPKCGMARMRPDGSEFEVTSIGPNNIWGLVITGEGEAFIQEANDYGYPVMPFHEYAYYPGGMDSYKKSYQPDFPPQAEFRMGGTGLSGLALLEVGQAAGLPEPAASQRLAPLTMLVANPIISKIQTIAMHREPSSVKAPNGWRLEQMQDFITCDDPFFRPVGMTQGPDGCIYITDWYNKIISHNEVPRAHPDRDKTRGRIWRVKPKSGGETPLTHPIPDFTKLEPEQLIAMLGDEPLGSVQLAWQTLADAYGKLHGADAAKLIDGLKAVVTMDKDAPSKRVMALAAYEAWLGPRSEILKPLLSHKSANIRQHAARSVRNSLSHGYGNRAEVLPGEIVPLLEPLANDLSPTVRFAAIQSLGRFIPAIYLTSPATHEALKSATVSALLTFAKPSLPGPLTQSSRSPKQIPIGAAYDREFERFLVRMFMERHPDVVARFLDTDEAAKLPVEARVLASLALEPKASASRVAKLLPQLNRAPNDEELLRLAQFPEEAGCGDALKALLSNAKSRAIVAERLLAQKTKLDAAKIAPLLSEAAKALLGDKNDERALGVSLIGGFQLASLETDLVAMAKQNTNVLPALQALRELRSGATDLFASLATATDPMIRDEALAALTSSKNPNAAEQLFTLYPTLNPAQQRAALNALSASKSGAKAIVSALANKRIPATDLDGPTAERLSIVLGEDAELAKVMQSLGHVFHNVLAFDGSEAAWIDSKITLDGPFTVEAWVRLAEGIGNEDDLLGVPGGVEMNFFQSKFRVFGGAAHKDVVIAKKPMTPDLWTHLAVTRDAKGILRIYQNGELDATAEKPVPDKWEDCRIGWSGPKKGTAGMMAEFRVWKTEHTAAEIRAGFDRSYESNETHTTYPKPDSKLQKGARLAKTTDYPPILTTEQATKLDAQFTKFSALAHQPGNLANGKILSAICMACHQIGNAGGQIGPNLSGAGAMGLEGVLRNILTPNAAMESGYRIFRVELKSGDIVDALFVSEDKQAFITRQAGLQDRRIEKKDVRSTRYIRRSLMPEGLLDAFSDAQVTDLMSYLMTLK